MNTNPQPTPLVCYICNQATLDTMPELLVDTHALVNICESCEKTRVKRCSYCKHVAEIDGTQLKGVLEVSGGKDTSASSSSESSSNDESSSDDESSSNDESSSDDESSSNDESSSDDESETSEQLEKGLLCLYCCECKLQCLNCGKFLGSCPGTPRGLRKFQAFLCQTCEQKAQRCHICDDEIVILNQAPYGTPVELIQTKGVALFACAKCGTGQKLLKAQCYTCDTLLVQNDEPAVSYQPGKLFGLYLVCNQCATSCDECSNVILLHTPSTRKIMDGKNYFYSNLKICSACYTSAITCVCFAPAAKKDGTLLKGASVYVGNTKGDLYYRCRFCSRAPILEDHYNDEGGACELFQQVYNWVFGNSVLKSCSLIPQEEPLFFLVEPSYFKGKQDEEGGSDTAGLYHKRNKEIYLLDALPLARFIATLAHEMGHVWQDVNGITSKQQEPDIFEGFAEWLSYVCLEDLSQHFANDLDKAEAQRYLAILKESPNLTYGGGLRKFLEIGGLEQIAKVLDAAKKVHVKS